jgi:hypothetical protein
MTRRRDWRRRRPTRASARDMRSGRCTASRREPRVGWMML